MYSVYYTLKQLTHISATPKVSKFLDRAAYQLAASACARTWKTNVLLNRLTKMREP